MCRSTFKAVRQLSSTTKMSLYAVSGMGLEAAALFKDVQRLHKNVTEKISTGQIRYLEGLVEKANGNLGRAKSHLISARDFF